MLLGYPSPADPIPFEPKRGHAWKVGIRDAVLTIGGIPWGSHQAVRHATTRFSGARRTCCSVLPIPPPAPGSTTSRRARRAKASRITVTKNPTTKRGTTCEAGTKQRNGSVRPVVLEETRRREAPPGVIAAAR